jgi:outer membrane protein assembly factor BamB
MVAMHRRFLLVVALFAVFALAGCDWAQIGFDAGKSNFDPSEPALTPSSVTHLGTAWTTPCRCLRTLVADGDVFTVDGFVPGQSGPFTLTVRAFQASTGIQLWALPLGSVSTAWVVAVGNGVVYLDVQHTSGPPQIVGLDEGNGSVHFAITPPAPGAGVVALNQAGPLAGRLLFVSAWAGEDSEVSAIDPDGHVVWSAQPGGFVEGLAAAAGGPLYASSIVRLTSPALTVVPLLTGLGESDGAVVSRVIVGGQATTNWSPLTLFQNGLAYGAASSAHGGTGAGGVAVDPATGAVTRLTGGNFLAAVSPTAAILQDEENDVFGVNPKTGTQLWLRFFSGLSGPEADAIAGSLLYVGLGANVLMLDVATGTTVATTSALPGGVVSIVPSGGRIFTIAGTTLVALQPT